MPIDEFTGPLDDPLYIYGAIDLVLGRSTVLDSHYWDLVDQLWSYLVDMLLNLEANGEAHTFMADHATPIRFLGDRRAGYVSVEVGRTGTRRGSCGYEEFFVAMSEEARHFFTRMKMLSPGSASYDTTLRTLDDLQQRWPAVGAQNGST